MPSKREDPLTPADVLEDGLAVVIPTRMGQNGSLGTAGSQSGSQRHIAMNDEFSLQREIPTIFDNKTGHIKFLYLGYHQFGLV